MSLSGEGDTWWPIPPTHPHPLPCPYPQPGGQVTHPALSTPEGLERKDQWKDQYRRSPSTGWGGGDVPNFHANSVFHKTVKPWTCTVFRGAYQPRVIHSYGGFWEIIPGKPWSRKSFAFVNSAVSAKQNCLKPKFPMSAGGGGGGWLGVVSQLLMPSPKLPQTQISQVSESGGWGGCVFQSCWKIS